MITLYGLFGPVLSFFADVLFDCFFYVFLFSFSLSVNDFSEQKKHLILSAPGTSDLPRASLFADYPFVCRRVMADTMINL